MLVNTSQSKPSSTKYANTIECENDRLSALRAPLTFRWREKLRRKKLISATRIRDSKLERALCPRAFSVLRCDDVAFVRKSPAPRLAKCSKERASAGRADGHPGSTRLPAFPCIFGKITREFADFQTGERKRERERERR